MKIHRFFAIGVLLTTFLLCAPMAYAQDVTVSKPTKSTTNSTQRPTQKPTVQKNDAKPSASKPTTGIINGHEWVDLGLSVKWATCNIGASSPSDYGDYFAWGETKTKSRYTEENSTTLGKKMGSIAGDPHYDVARANWGGTWRLPTLSEMEELANKCNCKWEIEGEHYGYKITVPNGNSIFLPAAGVAGGVLSEPEGRYWSATPHEESTNTSYIIYFGSLYFDTFWDYRDSGFSIRPVSE